MKKTTILVLYILFILSNTVFAASTIGGLTNEEWISRGHFFTKNDDHDSAIIAYNNAITLNSQQTEVYVNRGNAYYQKELYDKAIADFSTAISINPQYSEAYYYRGRTYYDMGWHDKAGYDKAISNFNRAIADFSTAISINPQYSEAYYYRGRTYNTKVMGISDKHNQLILYEKAISDFSSAIKINPKFAQAYLSKAMDCQTLNRKADAIESYLKFMELSSIGNANYSYAHQQLVKLGYYNNSDAKKK